MQIKDLKLKKKSRKKSRRGRGISSGRGCKSGRGQKGQRSRSGGKKSPAFEGGQLPLYRRIPKVRGKGYKSIRPKYLVVNLGKLEKKFKTGEEVSPESLYKKNVISKKTKYVKILSEGNLKKKLNFKDVKFSKKALEKAKKAGAKVSKKTNDIKKPETKKSKK